MQTKSTKIKDFAIGDQFRFYGETFEVTSDVKSWTNHGGCPDTTVVYGRSCKLISTPEHSNISGNLKAYDWMQGIEEVTYSKIIEG